MFKKELTIPIYDIKFVVVFYDCDEKLKKEFEDYIEDFDHAIDGFDAATIRIENRLFLVFSTQEEGTPSPGVIAHEAKHLVNHVFLKIGCQLDTYNDEPECYLLGWIVNEIHKLKDQMSITLM